MSENGARKVRECDTRYLGQQRCNDCHRWCRRLGRGGECGHCGELLTVSELLEGDLMA
jgi:Zinc-ribbon containing domain